MITIIDYGMGNLKSIQNMLKYIGVPAKISSDKEEILDAEKIILPGVGAFDQAVDTIDRMGFRDVIRKKAIEDKTPVLGICLGMQLLGKGSEEGTKEGLGLIDAESLRFSFPSEQKHLKIPHMGWNTVQVEKGSNLFDDMPEEPRFYFVHSYHVVCYSTDDILCITDYGKPFVSAVAHENIYGVQYHPEKSHKFGMILLKNFAELS